MTQSRRGYTPDDAIPVPALYAWPSRPLAAIRFLAAILLLPRCLIFIGLAAETGRNRE